MASALDQLVAACASLSSDGRYAKKTRVMAHALAVWASSTTQEASSMETAKIHLSADDLAALSESNPSVIVAGPGAGKMLFPNYAIAVYKAGTTPYTDPGYRLFVDTLADWNNGAFFPLQNDNSGIGLDQTEDRVAFIKPQGFIYLSNLDRIGPLDGLEDQPLVVAVQDGYPLSGGDGTLDLTVGYTIVDLT